MIKKPINDLNTVFIDTGIFVDLLRVDFATANNAVVKRISQTRKFFLALQELKKDIIFQTSAINIAELFHFNGNNQNTVEAIGQVAGGIEIISFDETAALFHNQNFGLVLGNAVIEQLKKEAGYLQGNGFANIQDRIRKDILIASTAKQYECDIILTNDSGFKYISDKLDIFCHLFTGNESDFITSHNGEKIYNFS